MPTPTVENYLKSILQVGIRESKSWISTGHIAAELQLSPGTVTSMLKTLDESELVVYRPYEGAALTESGRILALRMVRRHRLIELFLVKTLSMTWDQVHSEAENMEHAVSDELIERIDQFLGFPQVDPHGDPIPAADGTLRTEPSAIALNAVMPGSQATIVRVLNQDGEFLRFLSSEKLGLGTSVMVEDNNRHAGILSISMSNRSISLGHPAASQILVNVADK